MIIEYLEDKKERQLTRDITVFRKLKDGKYRKSRELHQVRLLDNSYLLEILSEIGFETEVLTAYEDYTFRSNHKAIIAYKKYE